MLPRKQQQVLARERVLARPRASAASLPPRRHVGMGQKGGEGMKYDARSGGDGFSWVRVLAESTARTFWRGLSNCLWRSMCLQQLHFGRGHGASGFWGLGCCLWRRGRWGATLLGRVEAWASSHRALVCLRGQRIWRFDTPYGAYAPEWEVTGLKEMRNGSPSPWNHRSKISAWVPVVSYIGRGCRQPSLHRIKTAACTSSRWRSL